MAGGSLLVQINGSCPPNKYLEGEEHNQKAKLLLVADLEKQKLQNTLTTSPVFVRSKEVVSDMLERSLLVYII